MRILVSGSTGFIGSALVQRLTTAGHNVARLLRPASRTAVSTPASNLRYWDPQSDHLDPNHLAGFDAIIHLAGRSVVGRWTASHKQRIYSSRVRSTALLADALTRCPDKPAVLLVASAVGYYGHAADRILTESSPPANDFLARVVRHWEEAALPAARAGIRLVHMRFGTVLWPSAGMLKFLLPIFRLGLAGRLGSGQQFWSWIAIPDVLDAIEFVLATPSIAGPVNFTTPHPVTNAQFTQTLARLLHRPAFFHLPTPLVRLLLGQMSCLALFSQRALPQCLLDAGYRFRLPRLQQALATMLNQPQSSTSAELSR